MAEALASAGLKAFFSYAGRTGSPLPQPLPVRVGGFGGVAGLARFLKSEGISHVIDATHPFAAQMSRNAVAACAEANVPLIALERPQWVSGPGDTWRHVADIAGAAAALPSAPTRVFLAIGRQNLGAFETLPQHHYLVRLVDKPSGPLPLSNADIVVARGPFTTQGDLQLMKTHRIQLVVAKNSGGEAARAKLDAARTLGVPVIMIDRPPLPERRCAGTVAEVMDWLQHTHSTRLGV